MTHPTDDELEAIACSINCAAKELKLRDLVRNGSYDASELRQSPEYRAAKQLDRAAAMLRACKGGVVDVNVRKWYYYPIEMPITADGCGPATVGQDAEKITYEVWDRELRTHASFENLPDAINEAMRLNATLEPATEAPMRCAECECENGGAECTWIKTPDARQEAWRAGMMDAARLCDTLPLATDWAAAIRALAEKGPTDD